MDDIRPEVEELKARIEKLEALVASLEERLDKLENEEANPYELQASEIERLRQRMA